MTRPAIFLGDLADALQVLQPEDAETEASIARLLQLEPARTIEVLPSTEPMSPLPAASADQAPIPQPAPEKTTRFFLSRLESSMPEEGASPSIAFQPPQTPLTFDGSEADEPALPLDPLLRPASSRAILSAAVSMNVPIGIDVARTVELLAHREPLEKLPLRRVRSVRRGVQLLLDKSAAMMPFYRDQALFIDALSRVVGRQMVEIGSFSAVPQRGLMRGLRRDRPYRAPAAGTPIVLLTDLGIGDVSGEDGATPREWLEFIAIARHANCPLTAFVPYEASRWPRALRRAMTIMPWDRTLTAGRAAKRMRRLRE